jgi:hypothetical protein
MSTNTAKQPRITFAVDDVVPATDLLPVCRAHEALRENLQCRILGCSDFHGMVVDRFNYQSMLAAVYTAYCQHRPLVLSPDAIWITIAQGVAHHMAIHGEDLRSRFVGHQGKLELVFQAADWVEDSVENPWVDAFESWTAQIRLHVGLEVYDSLICDFSTTGPIERAASQVVMMDVFERYFKYVVRYICGIPEITLEGTPDDWQRLADKARSLEVFDLDWWLPHLLPICDQFVRASRGDIDLDHWQAICKLRSEYGGDIINGWVAKLFPYLREYDEGPCTRRNPIFETGAGFTTRVSPSGLSRVPFVWQNAETGIDKQMEAIGGLIGVAQDPETRALRPKVGWAIRRADIQADLPSGSHPDLANVEQEGDATETSFADWMPTDLCRFYYSSGKATSLFSATDSLVNMIPPAEQDLLAWGGVDHWNCKWYRLAWLKDGRFLAINTEPDSNRYTYGWSRENPHLNRHAAIGVICVCSESSVGIPGQNPVVAMTFTELLERLLASSIQPYWDQPKFKPYGDAEDYIIRPST